MNSFQRKSLYAALAGVGALGATGAADAVNLNPDGLGNVLIYPYYTVRSDAAGNAYNSLLTVVNTTFSVKAVKVRFLEGRDSREVIDFNLFLSPYDVWTAGLIPSPSSGGGRLVTFDKSCTLPPIATTQGGQGFVDFVNFAYSGTADDGAGNDLDRTKEGYVEIIEMATYATFQTVGFAVTHGNGKVAGQPDCKPLSDGLASHEQNIVNGGLFGGMTLIDVGAGTDYTEDAVALDNFTVDESIYTAEGTTTPDLTFAFPAASQVVAENAVYTSLWNTGPDPVSAVLMHAEVMNTYVLDPGTKSGSDWVVTFPTKRFYVRHGTGLAPKLFQRNFNGVAGSCDDVTLSIWDREENALSTPATFSPPPPTQGNSICWEANVVTFNNSNVLASQNPGTKIVTQNIPATSIPGIDGWMNLGFFPTSITGTVHELISTDTEVTTIFGSSGTTATYFGLPVVGFEVESYTNGTLNVGGTNVLSSYGGNFVHKYFTFIAPPANGTIPPAKVGRNAKSK
ncbi:MAG TPA: hypothetical protein VMN79_06770 [Casimicrobiaceae bacterium]|nr:hypothetical protein [Casimicrobiaceae bacterium]